jgi:hypothetical protein
MSHICALGIDALPDEVLLRVFQKLHPLSELLRYSSVCRRWKALGLQATKLTLPLCSADDTPRPLLENMRIFDLLGRLKFLEWLEVDARHWYKGAHSGSIDLGFLWVLVDKIGSLKYLELTGFKGVTILPAEHSAVLLSLLARLPCLLEISLQHLTLTLTPGFEQMRKADTFIALKKLQSTFSDVTQESLDNLLSCCPSLTNLSVRLLSRHPLDLIVKSPVLRELAIEHSNLLVPYIDTPSLRFATVVSKTKVVFHSHRLEVLRLGPCKLSAPPFSELRRLELVRPGPNIGQGLVNPTEQIHQLGTLASLGILEVSLKLAKRSQSRSRIE